MKKLLAILIGSACLLAVPSIMAACGDDTDDDRSHIHSLQPVEAAEATCIDQGNTEYQYCLYCNAIIKDGKEVKLADVTLPVDSTHHVNLSHYDEVPKKCDENGVKEHDKCNDCKSLLINGVVVSQADLVIQKLGTDHVWKENGVECSSCDAYKLLYNGDYYTIDTTNKHEIIAAEQPLYSSSSDAKEIYLGENGYYWSNRKGFATQSAKTSTGNNTVELIDGEYTITNINSNGYNTFTRFAYGDEDGNAYIGRFIMVYDYTVSADESNSLQRIGVKVTDNAASFINTDSQSKFIGRLNTEENNPERSLTKDTVYTFTYVIELTADDQLVQIVNCIDDTCTAKISNLHFIGLDEAPTGVAGATLLYFGETGGNAIVKSDCTHAYAEARAAKSATCKKAGYVSHVHCFACGKNFVDGTEISDSDLYIDITDHNYGDLVAAAESSCTVAGNDAYYRCDMCEKYFDDEKNELSALPARPLTPHSWSDEYEKNSEKHWHECTVCHDKKDDEDHIPGDEATSTTAQVCTVCHYVIAEPTAHVHSMKHTDAVAATCTADGNVEYWYCSGCDKYYSDENGETVLDSTVDSKTGHTMESRVEAKAPTCLESGNTAYSYCSVCDKYFDDENGTTDITDTYLIDKLAHSMTHYAANDVATCYQRAHVEYYHCSACNMLYTDDVGTAAVNPSAVFSGEFAAHDYDGETGACKNVGCNAKIIAIPVTGPATGGIGSDGDTAKNAAIENPGKWTAQFPTNGSAEYKDDTLQMTLSNHSKNTRNGFIRIVPADPNDPTQAYVGAYILSFDLTFTSISKNTITLGFGLQDAKTAVINVSHEEEISIVQGQTIRFSVLVESTAADQYLQFIARNPAGGSNKTFVISNASIEYLTNTSEGRWFEDETPKQMLSILELGTPVPTEPEEEQEFGAEAVVDDKKLIA